jgi:hypothetical protein
MSAPKNCEVCGKAVEIKSGPGRTQEYRPGLALPVPDDFPIPTCTGCGEEYVSEQDYRAIHETQKSHFIDWQKGYVRRVVDAIRSANKANLRDIERACGVTGTYLSHVLGGRNEASSTLFHLLEAFALYPAEFQRQRDGGDWGTAYEGSLRARGPNARDLAGGVAQVAAPSYVQSAFRSDEAATALPRLDVRATPPAVSPYSAEVDGTERKDVEGAAETSEENAA